MNTLTVAPSIQVTAVSLAVPTATPTKKPANAVRACRKLSNRATGHFKPVDNNTTKSPVFLFLRKEGRGSKVREDSRREKISQTLDHLPSSCGNYPPSIPYLTTPSNPLPSSWGISESTSAMPVLSPRERLLDMATPRATPSVRLCRPSPTMINQARGLMLLMKSTMPL